MAIGDIKEFPCPLCGKVLFRKELRQHGGSGDAIWLNTADRPPVETDSSGAFIKCPSCSGRVVMLPDPVHPDSGFYISPDQN